MKRVCKNDLVDLFVSAGNSKHHLITLRTNSFFIPISHERGIDFTMGLLIGSDQVIAQMNTYWLLLNLFIGAILFVYFFILYLLGFVSILGDAIVPGLLWKIPSAIALLLGNMFTVTMNYQFIVPLLVLHSICLVAAIIESYLVYTSLIGCITGTLMIPCGSDDEIFLIVIGILTAVFDLALLFSLVSLIDYMRGFNRILLYTQNERTYEDYQDQVEAEEEDF